MTSEDALERDILAEPDDDGLRLIYADWLDDHGDADRAAYVRVQVERAVPPGGEPCGQEREARAAELWAAYREVGVGVRVCLDAWLGIEPPSRLPRTAAGVHTRYWAASHTNPNRVKVRSPAKYVDTSKG